MVHSASYRKRSLKDDKSIALDDVLDVLQYNLDEYISKLACSG